MRLPLVDCKLDRPLQVHADGGEYLQPCSVIALTLDDIQTNRHLTGRKRAGDRGPAMHLCAAWLEAEFSPVSISNVLYLSLPAGRNVGTRRLCCDGRLLLRSGWLVGRSARNRRQQKRSEAKLCMIARWPEFGAMQVCHGCTAKLRVVTYPCSSRNFVTSGPQIGMASGEPIKKCPSLPYGGTK
jgi:hypothetical protein